MPQPTEHVEAALQHIQTASEALPKLDGLDQEWKDATVAKLSAIDAMLRGTTDRFLLKSRLGLPFAKKCDDEAAKLEALVTELTEKPAADGRQRLSLALDALDRAARVLDERSRMEGMVIT